MDKIIDYPRTLRLSDLIKKPGFLILSVGNLTAEETVWNAELFHSSVYVASFVRGLRHRFSQSITHEQIDSQTSNAVESNPLSFASASGALRPRVQPKVPGEEMVAVPSEIEPMERKFVTCSSTVGLPW